MNAEFARTAQRELDVRVRHYSQMIARGQIEREAAQNDVGVWHAIARALDEDRPFGAMLLDVSGIGWRDVIASLDRARDARAADCTADPENTALAARRDAVAAVDRVVRRQAEFFIELNAELGRRSAAAQPIREAA